MIGHCVTKFINPSVKVQLDAVGDRNTLSYLELFIIIIHVS